MSAAAPPRLKRMRLRAWRRGTREMDLILGGYADRFLGAMDAEALDRFETLLAEEDTDLYAWITGREAPPAALAGLVADLRANLPGVRRAQEGETA